MTSKPLKYFLLLLVIQQCSIVLIAIQRRVVICGGVFIQKTILHIYLGTDLGSLKNPLLELLRTPNRVTLNAEALPRKRWLKLAHVRLVPVELLLVDILLVLLVVLNRFFQRAVWVTNAEVGDIQILLERFLRLQTIVRD